MTPKPEPAACNHPVARRFAWYARDDAAPGGLVLCVACSDCGAVLQGAAVLPGAASSQEVQP